MTTNVTDWDPWLDLIEKCVISNTPIDSLYTWMIKSARNQGDNGIATLIEYHYGDNHEKCHRNKKTT